MPHAPAIGAEGIAKTNDLGLLGRRDLRGRLARTQQCRRRGHPAGHRLRSRDRRRRLHRPLAGRPRPVEALRLASRRSTASTSSSAPGEVMALLGRERRRQEHAREGARRARRCRTTGTIEIDGAPADLCTRPPARRRPASRSSTRSTASCRRMTVAENLVLGQGGVAARSGCRGGSPRGRARCWTRSGSSDLDPRTPVERLTVAEMQLRRDRAPAVARRAHPHLRRADRGARRQRDRRACCDVIRGLAAEGRSVIYVTHRLPEVFRLTDRVTVFRNGRSLPPRADVRADIDARHQPHARPRARDDVPAARTRSASVRCWRSTACSRPGSTRR